MVQFFLALVKESPTILFLTRRDPEGLHCWGGLAGRVGDMSHIFISYARKDIEDASKIVRALAASNFDTWADWKDIQPGTGWLDEIYRGIEEADAFLFFISPRLY